MGIISLVVLAVAIAARYGSRLRGACRKIYVISAVAALYLNVFVLIVQLFLKVPALHALAPKGSEPPFAAAQLANPVLFHRPWNPGDRDGSKRAAARARRGAAPP